MGKNLENYKVDMTLHHTDEGSMWANVWRLQAIQTEIVEMMGDHNPLHYRRNERRLAELKREMDAM